MFTSPRWYVPDLFFFYRVVCMVQCPCLLFRLLLYSAMEEIFSSKPTMLSNFARTYTHSSDFFNREKEMSILDGILQERPIINVFTGPPDSRKSSLLSELLRRQAPFSPLICGNMHLQMFHLFSTQCRKNLHHSINQWKRIIPYMG